MRRPSCPRAGSARPGRLPLPHRPRRRTASADRAETIAAGDRRPGRRRAAASGTPARRWTTASCSAATTCPGWSGPAGTSPGRSVTSATSASRSSRTDLVADVEQQARLGDGWVKLVGDWIDRDVGDLAPLWPDDALTAAVARAHELGARVAAHVFGEDALAGLVAAGVDTHRARHRPDRRPGRRGGPARDAVVTPTLINIENVPGHRRARRQVPGVLALTCAPCTHRTRAHPGRLRGRGPGCWPGPMPAACCRMAWWRGRSWR